MADASAPKKPTPLAVRVAAYAACAAVGIPVTLAVVYGTLWVSVFFLRQIGGLF